MIGLLKFFYKGDSNKDKLKLYLEQSEYHNRDSFLGNFEEHYSKFAPVMEELKQSKFKLKKFEDFKEFLLEDIVNLFGRPYNSETRHAYYQTLCPQFPEMPGLSSYKAALNKLGEPSDALINASNYFHDQQESVKQIFKDNRFGSLKNHEHFKTATEIFSNHLDSLTENQLDLLVLYSKIYEQFTLVTLEPYMVFILGNTVFFNILVPLHREGACQEFITEAVAKQKRTAHRIILKSAKILGSFLYPWMRRSILTLAFSALNFTYYKITQSNYTSIEGGESMIARNTAKIGCCQERGLNNPYLDKGLETVSKVVYELGRAAGSFSRSFVEGVLSKHEDVIKSSAEKVDSIITKGKSGPR